MPTSGHTPSDSGYINRLPSYDCLRLRVIMDPKVSFELAKLDPHIPFRSSKSHVHHTWAKTFYSRPELYIQPESVQEIQKAITLARRCRRRLVVVGCGHSPSDLTCTSSWQMNLDRFNRILSANRESGVVTFESGISLHELGVELGKIGLSPPNLGSIDNQSIAGAISTGTHGSSLKHGLLSQSIISLSLALANGQLVRCSATSNPSLFRAALVSLGALGVITEITFNAVPAFNILWEQSLHPLSEVLETWDTTLWTSAEYSRVWWLPYTKRAVFWRATKSGEPLRPPKRTYYGGRLGFHTYHNLLYLAQYVPPILPWVEWFVFGMQYGFKPGRVTATAVQPAREGLLMDCLYSQFVNEWALPLEKGPEAITRLSAWMNGDDATARIPVSSKGVWVHCPIEVRVSDTTTSKNASGIRPYLDPTCSHGPTLYLNATLYRPYGRDPPCRQKYYEAFEWLMRELGGRPHWAKNFTEATSKEIANMYGENITEYMKIRNEYDPDEMFIGEWHRRNLPLGQPGENSVAESEKERRPTGIGDALEWIGQRAVPVQQREATRRGSSRDSSPSPPVTATSEESFDYLAKGEASMYMSRAWEHDSL
jgi:D-arabinono-1,4-lactone oxidase